MLEEKPDPTRARVIFYSQVIADGLIGITKDHLFLRPDIRRQGWYRNNVFMNADTIPLLVTLGGGDYDGHTKLFFLVGFGLSCELWHDCGVPNVGVCHAGPPLLFRGSFGQPRGEGVTHRYYCARLTLRYLGIAFDTTAKLATCLPDECSIFRSSNGKAIHLALANNTR